MTTGSGDTAAGRITLDEFDTRVAEAGIRFEDRGDHELRGIPGTWQLYSVSS